MLTKLSPHKLEPFPDPSLALEEPNGLLAVGGDLRPERILMAYQKGIFPWFNPEDPILWWSPNPRTIFYPDKVHVSRSLQKIIRRDIYRVTFDQCFSDVIAACSQPRVYADGTWISDDIISAYSEMHRLGYAHSVEVWQDDQLVGGLYGMALGKVFFGESMFSRADNASKVGFVTLAKHLSDWGFVLMDAQVPNLHLFSLGAVEIPRAEFQQILIDFARIPSHWNHTSLGQAR
jgi:leucyl/phenylalanyl-tRNA---protein transferase